jgi:hypothetical protein
MGHVVPAGNKSMPGFGEETEDLDDVAIDEKIILK